MRKKQALEQKEIYLNKKFDKILKNQEVRTNLSSSRTLKPRQHASTLEKFLRKNSFGRQFDKAYKEVNDKMEMRNKEVENKERFRQLQMDQI